MSKVLIVTFDGMDYQLMQDYNLDNIPSDEFGTINNSEGICVQVTTELFASFLTGVTHEEHGIVGLDRYESDFLNEVEKLNRYPFFRKFSGLRRKFYQNIPFLNSAKRHVVFKDYPQDTFLDKRESANIGVRAYSPGYNVDILSLIDCFDVLTAEEELDRFETAKKQEMFNEMQNDNDIIMAHFHKTDHIHHWYWEVGKMEKVEETYHEADRFAGEILEKAEENGFETVIFMSDHGLPDVEEGGHNENAFYSCNHELFGEETPHITDFHDKILELTSQEDDLEGIDL